MAVKSDGGDTYGVSIVVSGNSGSPNQPGTGVGWSPGSEGKRLFVNLTSSTVRAIKTGNSWGTSAGNDWFIVIGSANPGVTDYSGDFIGANAFNLLGTYAPGAVSTVIVNPGTYVLTNSDADYRNISLIGMSNSGSSLSTANGARPILSLNGGTDYLDHTGNRSFRFGRKITGIHFLTNTALAGANMHSIDVGPVTTTTGTTEISDCFFEDVTLTAARTTTPDDYRIYVKDCIFKQTNVFTDRFSCMLPAARAVNVENCTFQGNGYALGIGDNGSGYVNTASSVHNIQVKNCIMDLTGFSIDDSPPDGTEDNHNYFYIQAPAARINIDSCQILVDNTLVANTTSINAALLTSNTFNKFIHLYGDDITIRNCLFNGPMQSYNTAGTPVPIVTLALEPRRNLGYFNNKIIGGSLPCQVSGANAFVETTARGGAYFADSEFFAGGNTGPDVEAVTVLDVDVDQSALNVLVHGLAQININNCSFMQTVALNPREVPHVNIVGGDYDAHGIVQIFAPGYVVNVSNSRITGNLMETGALNTPYNHHAGLVINNFDGASALATNGVQSRINVHHNDISVDNTDVSDASATQSASSLYVKGSILNINNNYLNMDNSAGTAGNNFAGCLYIENLPSTSTPFSDGLVQGNIMSRITLNGGGAVNLNVGYVYITSTSGRGMINDNSFSHTTIDGALPTPIIDATSAANQWIRVQNKNQTDILEVRGSMGQHTAGIGSVGVNPFDTSSIGVADNVIAGSLVRYYYDSPNTSYFFWLLPCREILPEYVTITRITVSFITSTVPAQINTIDITIEDNTTSETTPVSDAYELTSSLLTFTPSGTFINNPYNSPMIRVTSVIDHDAGDISTLYITKMTIWYRW